MWNEIFENVDIRILNKNHQWVSRGGIKLSNALREIKININEKHLC